MIGRRALIAVKIPPHLRPPRLDDRSNKAKRDVFGAAPDNKMYRRAPAVDVEDFPSKTFPRKHEIFSESEGKRGLKC